MSLQAQQIVSLACQIAKCPAYTSQAGQFLNTMLQSLAQNYDFEVIRKSFTFNFNTSSTGNGYTPGCGPNLLPADFLRAHKKGAFYMISGVPYTMIGYEQNEFDQFVQQAGNQAFPYAFYVDVSKTPMELYVWVPAAGAYAATVRYNPQMADITAPETSASVPWFPNTDYLIDGVAALERIIDAVTHTSPMPGAQQAEFPNRVHKLKPVHERAEVLNQLDAVVLEGIERLIDIDLPPQMLVGPWRQFKE
jgi:hypothetical protein